MRVWRGFVVVIHPVLGLANFSAAKRQHVISRYVEAKSREWNAGEWEGG